MRDLLELPIPDSALDGDLVPYWHPAEDSPEMRYLRERRAALGGPAPARKVVAKPLPMPADKAFDALKKGSGSQEIATTMAFVRLVKDLMRDKETGRRWVPIVPDEARTFGMESLFPSAGLYSPKGQTYDPVDRDQLLYYKEAKDGQILNEGITEAGSLADFTAAATSYATHGEPMIPFYIFYSMFGFQRTADQFWALADQLGRGFVIGATAGRTTMTGEGLQHADGHSHLIASTNPAALSYDPAFAYEVAVIVRDGPAPDVRRPDAEDVFYYLTVYNEPRSSRPCPQGVEEGILKGLYRFQRGHPARGRQPAAAAAGVRHRHPLGPGGAAAAGRGLGRGGRRVVGAVLDGAAPRRAGVRRRPAGGRGPDPVRHPCAGRRARPGRRGQRLDAGGARPDRAVGRAGLDLASAPTASACPTPARRPAATSASTRSRWSSRRWPPSPAAARSSRRRSRRPGALRPVTTRGAAPPPGRRPPSGHPDSRAEATFPRPGPPHGNPLRPADHALTTAGRASSARRAVRRRRRPRPLQPDRPRCMQAMRAARLIKMVLLLQARPSMTAAELARELEVSERTVARDVLSLSEAGVPVYADRGRAGGYRLDRRLPHAADRPRPQRGGGALPVRSALRLRGMGLADAASAARLKVSAALLPELRDAATGAAQRFHLDAPGWYQRARDARPAARDRRRGLGRPPDHRPLPPQGHRGGAGVGAVRPRAEGGRLVSGGRVRRATTASTGWTGSPPWRRRGRRGADTPEPGGRFARDASFDLPAFWAERAAQFARSILREEVVLRLSPRGVRRLPYVTERAAAREAIARAQAAGRPRRAGPADGHAAVESAEVAYAQLLALGPEGEVLAPPELRDASGRAPDGRAVRRGRAGLAEAGGP